MQNILQKIKYILHEHWLDLFLMAYLCTCIDIMATANGILIGSGEESNPLVTAIIPSAYPIYQIAYMAGLSALAFWGMYCSVHYLSKRYQQYPIRSSISTFMVSACCIHIYGAATWAFA